ncbi:MAG: Cob(I)yrinic acid a,c-diamide adenosyltransferase [uncultured bacterium]|nr:MAG: Cob(I)yrinic acid a,c-diamide adenosyltransferase [uncultured bacterium]HBD04856.1 cob(I)yrinic acid a,c-diamide adenosyltransferase [Candidatus Uhrbacteria bacterium]
MNNSSEQNLGLIQVITGDGKGKTTSALGLVLRAVGAGFKIAIVLFDKGGEGHYSERKALRERFSDSVDLFVTGRDRIDPVTSQFDFSIIDLDREEAERGLSIARNALSGGKYDLVILDEINSTVNLGMLKEAEVLEAISKKQPHTEVVLTGRNAPAAFIEIADLVSEVVNRKHYYTNGVVARKGIDF